MSAARDLCRAKIPVGSKRANQIALVSTLMCHLRRCVEQRMTEDPDHGQHDEEGDEELFQVNFPRRRQGWRLYPY